MFKGGKNMCRNAFDPNKYGMILCPACYGLGFIEYNEARNVCSKWGGFGLIKKEDRAKVNQE